MKLNNFFLICLVMCAVSGTRIFPMKSDKHEKVKRKREYRVKAALIFPTVCCLPGMCCKSLEEICGASFTEDDEGRNAFFKHVKTGIDNYIKSVQQKKKRYKWGTFSMLQWICPWQGCDKNFIMNNLKRNLFCHMSNDHTGYRPFMCKECFSYSGVTLDYLRKHVRVHHSFLNQNIILTWYPEDQKKKSEQLSPSIMCDNHVIEPSSEATDFIDIENYSSEKGEEHVRRQGWNYFDSRVQINQPDTLLDDLFPELTSSSEVTSIIDIEGNSSEEIEHHVLPEWYVHFDTIIAPSEPDIWLHELFPVSNHCPLLGPGSKQFEVEWNGEVFILEMLVD